MRDLLDEHEKIIVAWPDPDSRYPVIWALIVDRTGTLRTEAIDHDLWSDEMVTLYKPALVMANQLTRWVQSWANARTG